MARAESSPDRRYRGRPQLRPDDETRQIIYEAARHEFATNGFAATSTETVARRAGVSTKTLYRIVPNKAALFEGMVSDRLDRFLSDFSLKVAEGADIVLVKPALPYLDVLTKVKERFGQPTANLHDQRLAKFGGPQQHALRLGLGING